MIDRKPAFVGCDVETTGLDPDGDVILELGLVVFDDRLVPLAARSWITTNMDAAFDAAFDTEAFRMHVKSGLIAEILETSAGDCASVEKEALEFLCEHGAPGLPMLGSSISFDRMFLKRWMPRLLGCFSHRSLDATSVVLARKALGDEVEQDESWRRLLDELLGAVEEISGEVPMVKHRVIYDICCSAATARHAISPQVRPELGSGKSGATPVRISDGIYIGAVGTEQADIPVVAAVDVRVESLAGGVLHRVNVGVLTENLVIERENISGGVVLIEDGKRTFPPVGGVS